MAGGSEVPAAAALSCGSCGTGLSATAKFCSECGTAITPAARSAEYKQVTVLFADVVHSMNIAAKVGPERLREIMAELVERSAAVVRHYGGTVDKFTGDGIMALFGAPVTLEDHAVRACLAALGIQEQVKRVAAEVQDRDGVELVSRVGLNSGQVIAGDIGSGFVGYTAIGEQVGMAQRMESAAAPGEVMLSASTARLVEGTAALGERESVHIKGTDDPVAAHRLLGVVERAPVRRAEPTLVGRRVEMAAVEGLLESAIAGHGAVVGVVGPPGIGKSRLVREVSAAAAALAVDVFTTYCESHATDIPFRVVARLLRAATGIGEVDGATARAEVRIRAPDGEPEDMLLFDDLLGIADPEVELPKIDPDARRRRLTALVNTLSVAREAPAVYIVEDAHWIDEVSESMVADFLPVISQTHSLVLITYRPEYEGALARVPGAQTITLEPLDDSEAALLIGALLGPDPSVTRLGHTIAERAAGNPFFALEMVRELAERGVLEGKPGAYLSNAEAAEVVVPATLHATIAARIDRLGAEAKRTLGAAAVVGSRVDLDMLTALGVEPVVSDLVATQLIDEVSFAGQPEYVFHHPLVRAVAYESQLRSGRADMHRRVAAAIESRDPAAAEENAALIAEHLEAAGDVRAAYGWHMRAATWARSRDITAARLSWERARAIADAWPSEDPDRTTMRIAPRTMLCATAYRVRTHGARDRFDELRRMCDGAEHRPSLAIAMAGVVMDYAYQGQIRQASRLATEAMTVIESLGDATLTVGLSFPPIYAKIESGEYSDVLQWSQTMIDLADGDPFKGNFIFGSPLALAFTSRAMARYCRGDPGWRSDLRDGLATAHHADPLTYAAVVAWGYFPGLAHGVLSADGRALREIENALRIAERSGNDMAVAFARFALGIALVHRESADARNRGRALLADVSDVFQQQRHNLGELPLVNVYLAREGVRRGDRDEAIPLMCAAVDQLVEEGQLLAWGTPTTGVVVETLLDRAAEGDVRDAEATVDRLAAVPAGDGQVIRDIWLLRLRALLAKAHGDDEGYRCHRDRYRAMATSLGFEGHMKWADEMT